MSIEVWPGEADGSWQEAPSIISGSLEDIQAYWAEIDSDFPFISEDME